MPEFQVDWLVEQVYVGQGEEVDPEDGARVRVAAGHCTKEAACAGDIETELGEVLRAHFPEIAQTGYQDIHRIYTIDVTEI